MKRKGKFIVLEGGLGSGKTTKANLLTKALPGWKFYREPGSTSFGERMREAVQGVHGYKVNSYAAFFAYCASRANLIREIILPELEKGTSVILDRYWYSSWAYQGTEGMPKPIIWLVNIVATKGLKPDLILHYDVPAELGKKNLRNKTDADRYDNKKVSFHKEVRKNYRQLQLLYPGIWRTIDASKPVNEVFEESLKILKDFGIVTK